MLTSSPAFVLALASILTTVCALQNAPATPTTNLPNELETLLAQADRVALHAALHESHPSFADGTHENDLAAVQAIHREYPPLATRILELARRQNSNATTSRAAISQSTALFLTTYTAPDGKPTTITALTIIGIDATAAAGGADATGSPSSGSGSGTLQNVGKHTVSQPWEQFTLAYQAVAMVLLLGFVGMA